MKSLQSLLRLVLSEAHLRQFEAPVAASCSFHRRMRKLLCGHILAEVAHTGYDESLKILQSI